METHLPNAFFLFLFVPYFSLNAAMLAAVVPRSALHFLDAFVSFLFSSSLASSSSSSLDFEETHLPSPFFLFLFVPYFSLNAAMLAAVVPRSALHAFSAFVSAAD